MVRIIQYLIVFLFMGAAACAQQAKQYSFKHFSVTNGLSANTISAVIQDNDGYIWIATVNGLQRYDGNSFITFKTRANNPSSIPSDHIVVMYVDRMNNLWLISDNNRVGIFDTRKFIFREAQTLTDVHNYFIPHHLLELPTGELILMRGDGRMFRYEEKRHRFIPADNLFPIPDNWNPDHISWDRRLNKYWISCDSGLLQYDPATKHVNYRGHNIDQDPVIQAFQNETNINKAFTDNEGNVIFDYWLVNESVPHLCRYNRRSNKVEKFLLSKELPLGYHEVDGILLQKNGRLWVYGNPFLAEWTQGKKPFIPIANEYRDEQSIKFDVAFHAYEDRENNIWISTDNGVFLFNPTAQVFNNYSLIRPGEKTPKEFAVQAVAETQDKIFVGCWQGGIYCFDKKMNPVPLPSVFIPKGLTLAIWDMEEHTQTGEIWIGLQDGRLMIYNPKTNKLKEVAPEVFEGSTIRQLDEDDEGNLWMGTQSGRLIKWDIKKAGNDPSKGYEVIGRVGRVLKVHSDHHGYIWVATMGEGLHKVDIHTNKIVKTFTSQGPPGERLYMDSPGDMTQYNDSTLIVSAGCINIINTKTNKITYVSAENGLPSNNTMSVQKDRKGIIWVGMTNGLCRLNLQKQLVTYYDRRDGIAYDKFSAAGIQELSDGRMVFYTDHNFLVFDPADFGQEKLPPKPYITSFKRGGEPLSIDSIMKEGKADLKFNNTSISIDFSAMSYLQQRKLHYYYKMEPLDKDWIHADRPIEAIYNYLPPGDYVFKVKSENADGVTSKEIAYIPITVQPPFWRAWWFYAFLALVAILILYLLDRERMTKLKELQQLRRQIVWNLHGEISTTLNNINVLSEIAKIKADKNVEQSKEFIDQISGKSRNMIEAMEDMLWSIDPQNDSMKKTLLRMKELTDGIGLTNNIDIDLIIDHKVQNMELDMKIRHELYFFYKEALTYIVTHIACQQVFVNINGSKSKLMVEILTECANETEGFRKSFQKAMKKRVENLSASIDIIADTKSFSVALYVNV